MGGTPIGNLLEKHSKVKNPVTKSVYYRILVNRLNQLEATVNELKSKL